VDAFKYTMLFQMTTEPTDRASASAHSGGWSESFWRKTLAPVLDGDFNALLQARAGLLPKQASIVGFRIGTYTITGNQIFPGGTSTGRKQLPGSRSRETDVPQMALEFGGTAPDGNSSRFTARCIPDNQVSFGEYQPTPDFKTAVRRYTDEIATGAWCLLGRDLTKPSIRVLSIIANVVKLAGNSACTPGVDFLRFNRVYSTGGLPITGSYRIIEKTIDPITGGDNLTLAGLPAGTTAGVSGSARLDFAILGDYSEVSVSRIVVRKIGAPFEKYRGKSGRRARV
jgi:hypothetical protein